MQRQLPDQRAHVFTPAPQGKGDLEEAALLLGLSNRSTDASPRARSPTARGARARQRARHSAKGLVLATILSSSRNANSPTHVPLEWYDPCPVIAAAGKRGAAPAESPVRWGPCTALCRMTQIVRFSGSIALQIDQAQLRVTPTSTTATMASVLR